MSRDRMKVPVTLITGYLGAGKTTLLRNIISGSQGRKIAVVMNEFGKIPIDGRVIEGKDVKIVELAGGCVCCSLTGEFASAIEELVSLVKPEWILVETTGVAEPSTLAYDLAHGMPLVRLDAIITVVDADALLKSPSIGHTGMEQIELADLLLLNKSDLVDGKGLDSVRKGLGKLNPRAKIMETTQCALSMETVFGIEREHKIGKKHREHSPDYDYFDFVSFKKLDYKGFLGFLESLKVYRSKGFVRTDEGSFLMNFVAGRYTLEPFECEKTELVFIGEGAKKQKKRAIDFLKGLERI
jgi:G3E family GTPase